MKLIHLRPGEDKIFTYPGDAIWARGFYWCACNCETSFNGSSSGMGMLGTYIESGIECPKCKYNYWTYDAWYEGESLPIEQTVSRDKEKTK